MGWIGFSLGLACIVFSVWRLATLKEEDPNRDLWLNVSITILIIGILLMLIQIAKYFLKTRSAPAAAPVQNPVYEGTEDAVVPPNTRPVALVREPNQTLNLARKES